VFINWWHKQDHEKAGKDFAETIRVAASWLEEYKHREGLDE
jgi:hypothetical protein